jgi:hypothetical protein
VNALLRYLSKSMDMTEFAGHSAEWESRCIADLLKDMGYNLDVVNWKPITTINKAYDVTFDVVGFQGLQPGGVKLLHLAEADPNYSYQAELERMNGRHFEMRRSMPEGDTMYRAIEEADAVTLIGNEWTLSTYPEYLRDKIKPMEVSASNMGDLKKSVLYRYIGSDLNMGDDWPGHASKWAYACIAGLFEELGYEVAPWTWTVPYEGDGTKYDAVCSIRNLLCVADAIDDNTFKMMRTIMADPNFHNSETIRRNRECNEKHGINLPVDELIPDVEEEYQSIEMADLVMMNGNDYILGRFPIYLQDKLTKIDVAGSLLGDPVIREDLPNRKHFLWHFGWGAIRKGFDLVVDTFARHPDWQLSIVSKVQPDVLRAFQRELSLPNIRYYGWMNVSWPSFHAIVRNTLGFIAPTCSEGQSPAVATCMQLGMYPIISRQTGIDLPNGCGMYLRDLSVEAIEEAVENLLDLSDTEVKAQIARCQLDALTRYSRARYREVMRGHLTEALGRR